jgi:hypothetical protein
MQHEEAEQAALFEWAAYKAGQWPELAFMFHIPNGGLRNKATAARLKATGVKAGVPDIFLPVTRGQYAGLFVEMKYGKNKPSPEQQRYMDMLEREGYAVAVCYGCEQAIETITAYLRGTRKRSTP